MMRKESFYKAGPFIEYVHSGEDLVFYSNVEKLGMIEIFSDAVSYYSHFPKNTKDIITKWSYFTKDNVVARKAYRKFIFAFMELASLFACILIYKWFGIQISVALFISLLISRITVQFFRADLKIIKIQEIPLTAYLVLIFDISRLAGMVWGVIFLLSKKTSGIKL